MLYFVRVLYEVYGSDFTGVVVVTVIQMVLQQSLLARQDACAIRILQTGSDFNNWWSIHEVLIGSNPVGSSDDVSGPVQIRKQNRQGFCCWK